MEILRPKKTECEIAIHRFAHDHRFGETGSNSKLQKSLCANHFLIVERFDAPWCTRHIKKGLHRGYQAPRHQHLFGWKENKNANHQHINAQSIFSFITVTYFSHCIFSWHEFNLLFLAPNVVDKGSRPHLLFSRAVSGSNSPPWRNSHSQTSRG